jgi:hypothetical protein
VRLRIQRLKLLATTAKGNYSADLRFEKGLVLLHKDNTRGKSTALKAIIYALGLERVFGPVDQPPLPPVLTSELKDAAGEWAVAESWVFVEIGNADGRTATLRRKIAGAGGQDTKLINVWEGNILDDPQVEIASKAFYARDPGSATREQGIYKFLADFIGWRLPEVLAYDGTRKPLYMECLLSLFFIEQTQGWSSIQAITPKFFQIKQVEKKAIEFLLDLDACRTDIEREQLEQSELELRTEWSAHRSHLDSLARSIGGSLRELPNEPMGSWPPPTEPFLEVYSGEKAVPLRQAIRDDAEILHRLEAEDIPTADQAAVQIREQIDEAFRQLYGAEMLIEDTRDDLQLEKANLAALETRFAATEEDLEHNRGARKVRDLGFAEGLSVAQGECPTCHQPIDDSLLDQRQDQHVMTLDENIAYLEAQLQTLGSLRSRTTGAIEAKERRLQALDNYANEVRGRIRSLRRTLIAAGSTPSEAAVRERLIVDERLQRRVTAADEFQKTLPNFSALAASWRELQLRRRRLHETKISSADSQKLDRLESLFLDALRDFGFESFPVETIGLDRESYKPTRHGFDVSYDVSASDNIRVISAYLTAMLELSRELPTNHPGLLILDEPRQQNMKWSHFAKILKRLSTANTADQQVVIATSDQPDRIEELSQSVQFKKVDVAFEPWLLQPEPGVEAA